VSDHKIVGTYRVKNEERFIEKSLKSVLDICSEVVILDDNSTDKTVEICSSFDKVVDIQTVFHSTLNEVRDRNSLLQMGLKRNPDFILSVDGDEIFMPNAAEILFEEIDILYPKNDVFQFQFLTYWDKTDQIRFDGIFGNYWQKRLFRTKNQLSDLKFNDNTNPGNLHCGSVPKDVHGFEKPIRSNVKIFHMASIDEKLRQQKYDYYTKLDSDNILTDGYVHMVSGKGKFSGLNGIEIKKLNKEIFTKT
jgi:glycosyltransferase involved in cell wall biosynthesis